MAPYAHLAHSVCVQTLQVCEPLIAWITFVRFSNPTSERPLSGPDPADLTVVILCLFSCRGGRADARRGLHKDNTPGGFPHCPGISPTPSKDIPLHCTEDLRTAPDQRCFCGTEIEIRRIVCPSTNGLQCVRLRKIVRNLSCSFDLRVYCVDQDQNKATMELNLGNRG